MTDQEHLLDFVDRRLDAILRSPSGWGDPFSVENLVLLALNMPRMGGLEVLQEMGADDALRSIPVIILTTSAAINMNYSSRMLFKGNRKVTKATVW